MPKHTLMVPVTLHKDYSAVFEGDLRKLISAARQENGCVFRRLSRLRHSPFGGLDRRRRGGFRAAHDQLAQLDRGRGNAPAPGY